MREEVSFHMFLKKMISNHVEKEKFRVIMRKKKLLKNLHLNLKNTISIFFQAIEIIVNCIRNRFQQKDHIETPQKMAILLLNALHDEDFDHEL